MTESAAQLGRRPDAIVTCVGGGGLLNGVLQGMSRVGWEDIPVIGMETEDDHRYIVEPACGATLAAIYSGTISALQAKAKELQLPFEDVTSPVRSAGMTLEFHDQMIVPDIAKAAWLAQTPVHGRVKRRGFGLGACGIESSTVVWARM
nr:hypothetical protein BaRGS_020032 [Batillaria attramentaria]